MDQQSDINKCLTGVFTFIKEERDEHWTQTCTWMHKNNISCIPTAAFHPTQFSPEEGWRLNSKFREELL
jgi:hypothetical protein